METTFILIGIIIILILIIILLISNKNTKIIISSKNDKELSLDEKHKELLKNLNIDNSKGPIKKKKIIYRNGEKVSEETSNTENQIHSEAFTNCPNCGAKIEDANITNCPYCNTTLTNMKIITKKDS